MAGQAGDTKGRLVAATIETLRSRGIAGVSARTIAAEAAVNQALIFYHFGSVDRLLAEACTTAAAERVAAYHERFAGVRSLRELLAVGRELHAAERDAGNVMVLAQVLAGAQRDPALAAAAGAALRLWTRELEGVLDRVLAGTPLAEIADVPGLAHAVAAAFIGIELYEGADPAAAGAALAALDHLGALLDVLDGLGPLATRAVNTALRRARPARRPPTPGRAG
ncbi:TetR family transcriptional regulator [Sphaerisporangium rufum]|uniref:TetR family transcriptional regulator n=1 Tax=Sphaerisporangium rufum TaxID=1381558 RepID=A0A919R0T9_9ACTN|nr:TetR family transcriptional regulator [Sphaerisporangium rufum]GII77569.1 TetR family transcriptional regulator [Sphaerisporangium rufum]